MLTIRRSPPRFTQSELYLALFPFLCPGGGLAGFELYYGHWLFPILLDTARVSCCLSRVTPRLGPLEYRARFTRLLPLCSALCSLFSSLDCLTTYLTAPLVL